MGVGAEDRSKKVHPERCHEAWQTEVALRVAELRHRLTVVSERHQHRHPPWSNEKAYAAHRKAVEDALDAAKRALDRNRDLYWFQWEKLRAWWTGTVITAGWESVHLAEAELVDIEEESEVRASLPRLLGWIRQVMPSGDQRKRYEQELTDVIEGRKRLDRMVVRQAYPDVMDANTEKYKDLRQFRNQFALVALVIALVLAVLMGWHALNPDFVSLCGTIGETARVPEATTSAAEAPRRCLSGDQPERWDLAAVALVGAIGGLLSIAFGFGAPATPTNRDNPRYVQTALKPVAGAATALVGVLLIQSDILIAPAGTVSETLLLAYAAVFGFSQQLLTQFVDKRAVTLLGETDSETGKKKT